MQFNRVIFITNTSYPTEKAYGVTIGRSAQACKEFNIEREIWSAYYEGLDEYNNNVYSLLNKSIKVVDFLYKKHEKVAFFIQTLLVSLIAYKKVRKQKQAVVWTREIATAFLIAKFQRGIYVVIEIHHPLNSIERRMCRSIQLNGKVKFGFLTEKLSKNESTISAKCKIILPMAASKEFFLNSTKHFYRNKLRICYIGKGRSSGYDNGLLQVIQAIATCQKRNLQVCFKLIGLEEDFLEIALNLQRELSIDSTYLTMSNHISNKEIPFALSEFDIGLIPYLNSAYNDSRFPIKLVEYSAAGVIPLITDIPNHKYLISNEQALFYSANDPVNDLADKIQYIITQKHNLKNLSKNCRLWAEQYTYTSRVQTILDSYANLPRKNRN